MIKSREQLTTLATGVRWGVEVTRAYQQVPLPGKEKLGSTEALGAKTLEQGSSSRMTYDLLRLRLRGLIERIPRTRRYRVTTDGFRRALCFHRTYARVLRPVLSVLFDDLPSHATPLQAVVQRFDRELDRLWEAHSLPA